MPDDEDTIRSSPLPEPPASPVAPTHAGDVPGDDDTVVGSRKSAVSWKPAAAEIEDDVTIVSHRRNEASRVDEDDTVVSVRHAEQQDSTIVRVARGRDDRSRQARGVRLDGASEPPRFTRIAFVPATVATKPRERYHTRTDSQSVVSGWVAQPTSAAPAVAAHPSIRGDKAHVISESRKTRRRLIVGGIVVAVVVAAAIGAIVLMLVV